MSVCQKYMIEYSIYTKSEPLISIPKTESKSDEPFESYLVFFFIKLILVFVRLFWPFFLQNSCFVLRSMFLFFLINLINK